MRYGHEIMIRCDGCGAGARAIREVAALGALGEVARVLHPEGWEAGEASPRVTLAAPSSGQLDIDPFGDPYALSARIGRPVQIIRCPACAASGAEATRTPAIEVVP